MLAAGVLRQGTQRAIERWLRARAITSGGD
jgi:hypothetical protein